MPHFTGFKSFSFDSGRFESFGFIILYADKEKPDLIEKMMVKAGLERFVDLFAEPAILVN